MFFNYYNYYYVTHFFARREGRLRKQLCNVGLFYVLSLYHVFRSNILEKYNPTCF